jgi:hypothetical protein
MTPEQKLHNYAKRNGWTAKMLHTLSKTILLQEAICSYKSPFKSKFKSSVESCRT